MLAGADIDREFNRKPREAVSGHFWAKCAEMFGTFI
jgi:hypothetical protein